MTPHSPLTSQSPDRLSVWIVWAHYAVDGLIPTRTDGEEALWKVWRHD